MRELLLHIAQNLTDYPEDIQIDEEENGGKLNLTLHLNPDDMGKVIGKRGKIANSIRQILKACAIKENVKVSLKIVSLDEGQDQDD